MGIGEGYLEDQLLGAGHEVFALDLDLRSVERMTARGARAQVGRIEQMPFPAAAFDVVVTSESLAQELSSGYQVRRCRVTAFPGYRPSVPGQMKAFTRIVLARFQVAVAMPTTFWEAIRLR